MSLRSSTAPDPADTRWSTKIVGWRRRTCKNWYYISASIPANLPRSPPSWTEPISVPCSTYLIWKARRLPLSFRKNCILISFEYWIIFVHNIYFKQCNPILLNKFFLSLSILKNTDTESSKTSSHLNNAKKVLIRSTGWLTGLNLHLKISLFLTQDNPNTDLVVIF